MSKEALCLKIPKKEGEKAIILANKLGITDKELKIQRNHEFIYIPLIRYLSKDEFKMLQSQIPKCEIIVYSFQKAEKRTKTLIEYLEDKIPPHLLASLPKALDFVGNIAIIEIPPELNNYKYIVGQAVLKTHKNVRTVLAKAGVISGTYRLREFTVVAGEPKTWTIHKEYGCQYHVDLASVYFSPRLSYEHGRVASLTREGERIIDMFAGVGPFSILIAKTRENVEVYAIDLNPHAIELLKKNVLLNRVEGKVHPILGDAKEVIEKMLVGVADRVIMNLPEKAIDFVEAACKALKPGGGIIHFYSFINTSLSLEDIKIRFTKAIENCGRKLVKIPFSRLVRETAPYEWQAVIDAEIH
ncbi:MAG: class I SAM-dependent methyltransferase [Candidatus Bathyarchaeia archaeon]|nr:MAG: class I SAM-dependent methyltransferase family protein [Candidatus Bathyarchaeota archaeon]